MQSPIHEVFSYGIRHISLWFNEVYGHTSLNHNEICHIHMKMPHVRDSASSLLSWYRHIRMEFQKHDTQSHQSDGLAVYTHVTRQAPSVGFRGWLKDYFAHSPTCLIGWKSVPTFYHLILEIIMQKSITVSEFQKSFAGFKQWTLIWYSNVERVWTTENLVVRLFVNAITKQWENGNLDSMRSMQLLVNRRCCAQQVALFYQDYILVFGISSFLCILIVFTNLLARRVCTLIISTCPTINLHATGEWAGVYFGHCSGYWHNLYASQPNWRVSYAPLA